MVVFLDLNGYTIDLSRQEAVALVLEIAAGPSTIDIPELARRLPIRER